MGARGKILGIVITLVCLGLAFYRVDYDGLFSALARANYLLLAPALLLWLVGYLTRTVRWRVILAGAGQDSLFELFGVLMVGFATNNLLPARLGEVARAYLMRERTGMRKTFVLASIFLERLFDGLALVAVIMVLSTLVRLPGWGREVEVAAMALFVGAAGGVAILLYRHELAARIIGLAARPLPRRFASFATSAFGSFLHGLSSMRRPNVVVSTSILSIVVWTIEWAAYYSVASAFDLGLSSVDLAAACAFLLVVVNLGIMLPAAPGYVGTFQFFAVSSLGVWGIPKEPALAVAIVAHLTQYILVTAIGLAFFGREHVSLRSMSLMTRRTDNLDREPAVSEVRS
jgi:glycosyltransferase 2 family protein